MEGLSESLYYELRPFNIRIKLVEPGGIKTKFRQVFAQHNAYEPDLSAVDQRMQASSAVDSKLPGPESGLVANAQERENVASAENDHSSSDPGPENKLLLGINPNTNTLPPTDHGDIGRSDTPSIWRASASKKGGWDPSGDAARVAALKDIAGVNMRLTAGSFGSCTGTQPTNGLSWSMAVPASRS